MIVARNKREQNQAVLDPWTVIHFASGMAASLVNIAPRWAFVAAVGYEVLEQFIERTIPGQTFFRTSGPETVANSVADLVAFALGQWAGRRWNAS
jgi:hypothetical protein